MSAANGKLATSEQVSQLAAIGVAISSGNGEHVPGGGGPTFVFSKLNELKPSMIADATARAREAAAQFARDSHSELGEIRRANHRRNPPDPRRVEPTRHGSRIRAASRAPMTLDGSDDA